MFNPQAARRPPGSMQPNPGVPVQSQSDINAKEKLAAYVYEYLVISGASKTAEVFKEEVLNNVPNGAIKPSEIGPGFLQNWWMLFWDLYCAAPERRDGPDGQSTQEAKAFHDFGFVPGGFGPPGPMMNGMHGPGFPGGPGMGMPGPEGMMPGHPGASGFPGRFPGRAGCPPGAMPPGGFGMFPGDPRAMPGQRMPPNAAMRMPPASFAPGGMRPGGPGGPPPPQGMRYGAPPGGAFMDSPGQAFPPGAGMMPNGGGVMCSQAPVGMSMSSPGMPPAGAADPHGFMMSGMPSSSTAMPFGMGDTSVTMGNGMGPGGMGGAGPGGPEGGPLTGLLNGEELKQSPASTPRGGVNGGTPAPPGSAHSMQPASVPGGGDLMDQQSSKDDIEVSKIKQGLLDDFAPKEEISSGDQPYF